MKATGYLFASWQHGLKSRDALIPILVSVAFRAGSVSVGGAMVPDPGNQLYAFFLTSSNHFIPHEGMQVVI